MEHYQQDAREWISGSGVDEWHDLVDVAKMKCGNDVICTRRTRVVFVMYAQGVEQGADDGPGKRDRHSRCGQATGSGEATKLFRKG